MRIIIKIFHNLINANANVNTQYLDTPNYQRIISHFARPRMIEWGHCCDSTGDDVSCVWWGQFSTIWLWNCLGWRVHKNSLIYFTNSLHSTFLFSSTSSAFGWLILCPTALNCWTSVWHRWLYRVIYASSGIPELNSNDRFTVAINSPRRHHVGGYLKAGMPVMLMVIKNRLVSFLGDSIYCRGWRRGSDWRDAPIFYIQRRQRPRLNACLTLSLSFFLLLLLCPGAAVWRFTPRDRWGSWCWLIGRRRRRVGACY